MEHREHKASAVSKEQVLDWLDGMTFDQMMRVDEVIKLMNKSFDKVPKGKMLFARSAQSGWTAILSNP
jgi:hypothetical protein